MRILSKKFLFTIIKHNFKQKDVWTKSGACGLCQSCIILNFSFLCTFWSLLWRSLSLKQYIYLFRCQLKDASWCGNFSLHLRPVGDLLLLSALWSGCCLFDTFPISILNFIKIQFHNYELSILSFRLRCVKLVNLSFTTFYF